MNLAPSETSSGIPDLMVEVKSPEIDYDVKALLHSQTYYQSVQPRNGNPTHTVLANNTTETRFRVEKGVYNFSEFVLSYDASVPAPDATYFSHVFGSVLPIHSIIVRGEKNNAVLMDVPDMNIYGTQVPKFETSRKEYESRSARDILYPSGKRAIENTRYTGVQTEFKVGTVGTLGTLPSKGARPTDADEKNNLLWDSITVGALGTLPTLHSEPTSTLPASVNYFEHQYVSHTIPTGVAAVNISKSIRFGDVFKGSILAYNKLFPATEALEIIIRWCASSGWGFESQSAQNYNSSPRDMTKNIALSKLTLHMSQEQPHTYVYKKCVEMVEANPEGLILSTPLITTQEGQAPGNTQTTVPFFLSNGMGKKISKIIIVPTPSAPAGNTRYDFDNRQGSRVNWYWSKFNNQTIQPAQIDCENTDLDYQQIRKRLMDSPLGNFDAFRYNWAIYEDFSGCRNSEHSDYSEDSLFVGKDATSRDTFELKLRTGADSLILKCFFLGTQRIHIMGDGIRLLP